MNRRHLYVLSMLLGGLFFSSYASFTTLTQAQSYAEAHPEYVKPDNKNWINPIFSSFHKENIPGWFSRSLSWLGLYKQAFDIASFKQLLESVLIHREKEGFSGDFAEQFKPQKNDQFIIWGDLFSAFHSLMRDLTYLKKEGIIDESLKIIKPHYYFIFNGNVIDGSPYVMETLGVVLQLMKENPSRVFYTRGNHEAQEQWHNFELLDELKIRGAAYSALEPFKDLITRFFNTLPIALYLTREQQDIIDVILISNNKKAAHLFSEKKLAPIFSQERERVFFIRCS